jgi:transcriptional regulator with XRE-family HTH domain
MTKRLHTVKVDLQPGHVSEYESGKREPSLPVLLQYARIAGVSMETLVDDELELAVKRTKITIRR